ncbi:MAG: cyclase family protein [Candidatus Lutacidiplasmatales archaeon]
MRAMHFYDISAPLYAGMAVYPGDPGFAMESVASIVNGNPFQLSRITLSSHAGTHVDPPSHFFPGAPGADQLSLEQMNGPCVVLELPGSEPEIPPETLGDIPRAASRVLFKTANSARWSREDRFFPDYVALGERGARELLSRGVRLVGIDALSIDTGAAEGLPAHRLLLESGVVILEGLRLHGIPPGPYELRCLPLPLKDGDGAPARAVLLARES